MRKTKEILRLRWQQGRSFREIYNAWAERQRVTMRQVHKAGEKCFVDYSGKKPSIVDAKTGARVEVELFVAVMCASNYTFVEVTATQRSADWIASHVRLVEFLGGAPHALVPDQLKSGVVIASRYEPGIQRTYEEWSQHYSTTILPARPLSPRDKAKVEGGVLIAQRWILARLRNVTCFSLDEMNEHIAVLVADLNNRVMKRYGKSRRQLFEDLDRPAITPLPVDRFIHGDWTKATVKLDYHVVADHHDYSVPYQRATDEVWIRTSAATIEVYYKDKRCASHVRSFEYGGVTTNLEHLPVSHRKYAEESDVGFETWAATIGAHTLALVRAIHAAGVSPSQASPETVLHVDLYGTALLLEELGNVIAPCGAGVVIASQSGHRLPPLSIEQNKALATTPVDELLQLPFLQLDQVKDSLHAYQLAKRGNSLRVMAEAVRWGKRGARINTIGPGIIITPLAKDELAGPRGDDYRRTIASTVGKRAGTPDEVANVAALLLGPDGGFITGSDFLTDGGVTAAYWYGKVAEVRS